MPKLWGELVIATRSLARETSTLPQHERIALLEGLCGFTAALAARLRGTDEAAPLARFGGNPAWAAAPNPPDIALRAQGERLLRLMQAQIITPLHYRVLEEQVTALARVQAGCERIKTTPLPFSYSLLLHRTAYVFCILLPFALAPNLGWWTPLPVLLVSYAFFGLDALGDELSDPFGTEPNDLPLDAMVRNVERELLHAAGHETLPPPLTPRNFILL